MAIELDKSVECFINGNYNIDSSIFREIEERRQLAVSADKLVNDIRSQAPAVIEPPQPSSDIIQKIINDSNYDLKLKKNQLESVLDQIKLLDVLIDEVDELIIDLDKKSLTLVDDVNNKIENVRIAYDKQVSIGCSSNLKWNFIGTSFGFDANTGLAVTYADYEVIKGAEYEVIENKYGIKYYQKPSNQDYGFSLSSQFQGTIQVASNSLAIVSSGGTANIQIGDEVTDDLTNPSIFNIGNLPKVVGFGTTNVVGVTTTLYGTISTGSTIIACTGAGSTNNIIAIGFPSTNVYAINDNLQSNSKVVGFGTTTVTLITYLNNNVGVNTVTVPSVILDKAATGFGTNIPIGFGSISSYPSLELDAPANFTAFNENFYAIRQEEDLTGDFDFTKSPIDPVKVAIINSNTLGEGNKSFLTDNGKPSTPQFWREVLDEEEPDVGNDFIAYYVGSRQWPIISNLFLGDIYAEEGVVYKVVDSNIIGYTSTSPTGLVESSGDCQDVRDEINEALEELNDAKNNIPNVLEKYTQSSNSLRKIRSKYETNIWAYYQSASYLRKEIQELEEDINSLGSINLNDL
jgi:hypothetical protein